MNYNVSITSAKPETPTAVAAPAMVTKREMLFGLGSAVLMFLSTSGIKCSDGLPVIPAGIKVTHGSNFVHFDWPDIPAPAPIPDPGPSPTPTPVPPIPQPAPIPIPPPVPQPIATGQLHATLLLDRNNPSQPYAQLRNDLTIGGALSPFNCVPRAYFSDEQEVQSGLVPLASKFPCLIFQDRKHPGDKTAPVVSVIYPTSIAECVAEAKRLRGVN